MREYGDDCKGEYENEFKKEDENFRECTYSMRMYT